MRNLARQQCFLLLICGLMGWLPSAWAQSDIVLKAMHDEMDRSMKQLRIKNLDRPYFIAYRVRDVTTTVIEGTLGSLTRNQQNRARWLTVEVRVGSYDLDNTNFFSFSALAPAGVMRSFGNMVQLPLEDDYKEIRRQIWLATDAAYKKAAQDLARKKAVLQTETRGDSLPDFSREDPIKSLEKPAPTIVDLKQARGLVRKLSAIFQSMPGIYQSSATLQASNEYTYYLNSEGAEYTRATPFVGLTVIARTQAVDGMPLSNAVTAYARSLAGLSGDRLLAKVVEMGEQLTELRSAPAAKRYEGPVLFEGQASVEIFAQAFAPRLVASRRPLSDNPQFDMVFSRMENPFQDRVGARVLPVWASVSDNPAARDYQGVALLGGYSVDDEGVRARNTTLVENGILKTLLRSRDPIRGMLNSTGNARGFGVAPTNLFFTVQHGLDDAALKNKLLELVRQRGKPYGIIVRRLSDPLLGNPQEAMRSVMSSFLPGLGGAGPTRSAVLVYEIFPDGSQQLIRNAQIKGIDEASFKDLIAASASETVYSKLFTDVGNMVTRMFSGGGLPDAGNPPVVSLVVPDLLFEDVSVNPPSGNIPKSPLSPPPFEK
jgi:hypothetical protein